MGGLLESLKACGVTVLSRSNDDYILLATNNHAVAAKFGFALDVQVSAQDDILTFKLSDPTRVQGDADDVMLDCDLADLDHLVGKDDVVQFGRTLNFIIDYPQCRPVRISLPPRAEWTRRDLAAEILNAHRAVFATPESRQQHEAKCDDLADLVLEGVRRDVSGHWWPVVKY